MEDVEDAALEEVGQPPQQSVEDFAREAAGNYLVRKKILYYAIYQENGKKILREKIGSLRLVQKSWLQTISELFKTNGDPLFKFELDANDSFNEGSLVRHTANVLDQFVESVSSSNSTIHDIIPTFSLTLYPSFFRLENHNRLYNCLRFCGAELLELHLELPMNIGSLPGIFPENLSLGRLKTLIVYITAIELTNMENWEPAIAHDSNAAFLLQTILLGATALTELKTTGYMEMTRLPTGFQFLALPSTLTKIHIDSQMESAQIELLAECELPHLVELHIYCNRVVQYQNDAFYRIFKNFRLTLRFLNIDGEASVAPYQNVLLYQFPVMEKLESFETASIHCELRSNQSPTLKTCLPKVHKVCLLNQSVTAFRNWTGNSTLSSVKTLCVMLTNRENWLFNWDTYIHNLDENLMLRLHTTFPNLTELELVVQSDYIRTCGLKYLFRNMTQLVNLKLHVSSLLPHANSDALWDALLIGVPVEAAAGLQANPDIWHYVEIKSEELPSIVRLKELKCLMLHDLAYRDHSMRLISDMAFYYAFLNMTKLETIHLQGRFKASARMTEEWNRRGKTLVYPPPLEDD